MAWMSARTPSSAGVGVRSAGELDADLPPAGGLVGERGGVALPGLRRSALGGVGLRGPAQGGAGGFGEQHRGGGVVGEGAHARVGGRG